MGSKFVSKKSWRSKLEKAQEPSVCEMTGNWAQRNGAGTMLITTPMMVKKLREEGHRVVANGKKMVVESFAKALLPQIAAPA